MARRSRPSGSGVLAGVVAAVIAYFVWARYLGSSHTFSSALALLPGDISYSFGGPDFAELESGPIPLPNWIPMITTGAIH